MTRTKDSSSPIEAGGLAVFSGCGLAPTKTKAAGRRASGRHAALGPCARQGQGRGCMHRAHLRMAAVCGCCSGFEASGVFCGHGERSARRTR